MQFAVQNSRYTTALITSVGANNATNASFDDKSTSDHTLTAANQAHQTTFSPYASGGYSAYFDGTGDKITVADNADFNFGSGNSTLEMWVYPTDVSGTRNLITRGTSGYSGFILSHSGFLESVDGSNWGVNITFSSALTANSWQHIAVVRNGNTWTVYKDGTSVGTGTATGSVSSAAQTLTIGERAGQSNFAGYMMDLRIVKGTAVYTSNFTAPTERLTAITNTSLLACHLPYFADGSTNNHTVTPSADTSTKPFVPFDHQEYSAATHGGSMSLDGSSDSISAANSADFGFGTGDFTVEWWIYFDSIGSYPYQIDMRSADNDTPLALFTRTNLSNQIGVYVSASIIAGGTYSFKPGIWTHYAVCKTGGYLKGYFNGKEDFSITCTRDYGSSESIRIGAVYGNNNYYVDGNMADVRIVKGTAIYTSEFTPPTAPLTAVTNTKLLVQSTDAGIIDKSQTADVVLLGGDAKSSTTQYKYLTSSMYFDGTGDYLAAEVDGKFFTNPWTIEMWIWAPNYTGTKAIGPSFGGGSGAWNTTNGHQWISYTYNGDLWFQYFGTNNSYNNINIGTVPLTNSTWCHWAYCWDGTTLRFFKDGTLEHSTTTFTPKDVATTNLNLGRHNNDSEYKEAYYSDVRITKGLARYTSNFTAPTAALQG